MGEAKVSKKIIAAIVLLAIGMVFCGIGWRLNRIDLDSSRARLVVLENELRNTGSELEQVKTDLSDAIVELEHTSEYLLEVEANLNTANQQLLIAREELNDTKSKLSAIKSDRFRLHDPTFKEAVQFMIEDKTDSNHYVDDKYVCSHFASDVNNNAEEAGIRCAFVDVRFPNSAHAIVAFDTVDEGIVFFDPLTDDLVRPVIGKEYWRCIEPKPGYYYEEPTFDDTITDIIIIW